jgi:hypothetical protein
MWFPESPAYGSISCRVRFASVFTFLLRESTESKRGQRVAVTRPVMTEAASLKHLQITNTNRDSLYTIYFSSHYITAKCLYQ